MTAALRSTPRQPDDCQGACCAYESDEPRRKGVRVRVRGGNIHGADGRFLRRDDKDWGAFVYCPEAIADDRARGFTVEEEPERAGG